MGEGEVQFAQPFLPAVKVGREWVYSRHTPAHEISGISTHCLLFESLFFDWNPKKFLVSSCGLNGSTHVVNCRASGMKGDAREAL